jgi:uncharacterized protein YdeI (BOF family)
MSGGKSNTTITQPDSVIVNSVKEAKEYMDSKITPIYGWIVTQNNKKLYI